MSGNAFCCIERHLLRSNREISRAHNHCYGRWLERGDLRGRQLSYIYIEKTGDLSYTTAENGRLYLNLNDEKTDITDQCSDTDYFRKDYTDSEGNTHVLIAGRTVESYGWAEYIFNTEGKYVFNTMNIPTDEANPDATPVWFAKAEKDLGVDADALLEQGGSYKIDVTGIEQTETVTESAQ